MHFLNFLILRLFGFFISCLSYKSLSRLGIFAGSCAYYLHRSFRKKAMSSLAIAFGTSKSEKELARIAKHSFQNLMITCLEFFRFKKSFGKLNEIATLEENPELASLLDNKQGIIFLTAHQSNWEISFLMLTERYRGVAIGRPIKNHRLYKLILSVREMNGGKIVTPKNAIRTGMRALLKGDFLGIVGDQAYPESPYSYPLFGTRAWTASTPALLACKTGCPLVVGTTVRKEGRYIIEGSAPIWPKPHAPIKDEVPRMMDEAMGRLEKSIGEHPEQWMWVHDRWKQQGIDHVKRKYRYGFILIILPQDAQHYIELTHLLRKIYPRSFLTFCAPKAAKLQLSDCTLWEYDNISDLFVRDWRFQLVLDFYDLPKVRKHFLKLGAFKAISVKQMQMQATLEDRVTHHLVKKECLERFYAA